jgi:bifunctional ADP-heptose synthase (sugar kinase/adenylyltransferase)
MKRITTMVEARPQFVKTPPGWIPKLNNVEILVIGDVRLDHIVTARSRVSHLKAPAPVPKSVNVKFTPGGAANIARNLVQGRKPFAISTVR